MSTITRSGGSVWSTVIRWCSGRSASSFPLKKRSTPHNRIVATRGRLERMPDSYKAGLDHIRAGRFFEAHEELELAWRAAAAEERDFYQGLVHVAVAWYQAGRGNRVGCARQLAKAARRLTGYAPEHLGVDVGDVLAQVRRAAALVAGGSLELRPPQI